MPNSKKAQVSIEFIIVLSLLLIILLVTLTSVNKRNTLLNAKETSLYAKQVATQLSAEINAMYLANNGINKTIYLPQTLKDGTNYNISIYPTAHVLNIEWTKIDSKNYLSPIITADINGTLTNLNGHINLTNRLGTIQIN